MKENKTQIDFLSAANYQFLFNQASEELKKVVGDRLRLAKLTITSSTCEWSIPADYRPFSAADVDTKRKLMTELDSLMTMIEDAWHGQDSKSELLHILEFPNSAFVYWKDYGGGHDLLLAGWACAYIPEAGKKNDWDELRRNLFVNHQEVVVSHIDENGKPLAFHEFSCRYDNGKSFDYETDCDGKFDFGLLVIGEGIDISRSDTNQSVRIVAEKGVADYVAQFSNPVKEEQVSPSIDDENPDLRETDKLEEPSERINDDDNSDSQEIDHALEPSESIERSLELLEQLKSLRLKVVNMQDLPVQNYKIHVKSPSEDANHVTDSEGYALIDGIPENYTFRVSSVDNPDVFCDYLVEKGKDTYFFRIDIGDSVTLHLIDEDEKHDKNVQITVFGDTNRPFKAPTNEYGEIKLPKNLFSDGVKFRVDVDYHFYSTNQTLIRRNWYSFITYSRQIDYYTLRPREPFPWGALLRLLALLLLCCLLFIKCEDSVAIRVVDDGSGVLTTQSFATSAPVGNPVEGATVSLDYYEYALAKHGQLFYSSLWHSEGISQSDGTAYFSRCPSSVFSHIFCFFAETAEKAFTSYGSGRSSCNFHYHHHDYDDPDVIQLNNSKPQPVVSSTPQPVAEPTPQPFVVSVDTTIPVVTPPTVEPVRAGERCNQHIYGGGNSGVVSSVSFNMGQERGSFVFNYNTQNVPDTIAIYDKRTGNWDTQIFINKGNESTKDVYVTEVVHFESQEIWVYVVNGDNGTYWDYYVNCPE